MAWIKRNLFFAIGGAVAVLLLGAAAFYDYRGFSHNSAAFEKLNEIYSTLKQLNDQKPSPGDAKVNNTQTAKEQEQEVRLWIDQAGKYFKPIAPIPDSPEVTSEAYAAALRRMIDQLQHTLHTESVSIGPRLYAPLSVTGKSLYLDLRGGAAFTGPLRNTTQSLSLGPTAEGRVGQEIRGNESAGPLR